MEAGGRRVDRVDAGPSVAGVLGRAEGPRSARSTAALSVR